MCEITTCFDIPSNDTSVCSSYGTCIDFDTCQCDQGYGGRNCSLCEGDNCICYNVEAWISSVCSGNGNCTNWDTCVCNDGFAGNECEHVVAHSCFGLVQNSCSGNGICVEKDVCECHTEYYGWQCEYATTCFGILSNMSTVCSGNGACSSLDYCTCYNDYYTSDCSVHCNTQSTCYGNGQCNQNGQCVCLNGYSGVHCNIVPTNSGDGSNIASVTCFGISSSQSNVCSYNGICIGPNQCTCNQGYSGDACEITTCNQIDSTNPSVCNGHGYCISLDNCQCTSDYYGLWCQNLNTNPVTNSTVTNPLANSTATNSTTTNSTTTNSLTNSTNNNNGLQTSLSSGTETLTKSVNSIQELNGLVIPFSSVGALITFPTDFYEQLKSFGLLDSSATITSKSVNESYSHVIGPAISITISSNKEISVDNLKNPIRIVFNTIPKSDKELKCHYLDKIDSTWKTNGISSVILQHTDYIYAECLTTHLTTFAILEIIPENSVNTNDSLIMAFSITGIIVFLIIIITTIATILGVIWCIKREKRNKQENEPKVVDVEMDNVEDMYNSLNSSDFPSTMSSLSRVANAFISGRKETSDLMARYINWRKIGEGGFGSVYKVEDTKYGNKIKALKVIHYSTIRNLNQVVKEAAQILNVDHPSILKVNDFVIENDNVLCIDMDFYSLGDLTVLIKSKKTVSENILRMIIYQVCDALEFIQSKLRLIHRDIKPNNIFIKEMSNDKLQVVLADFGLAKLNHGTSTNSYSGTPFYMSPEVALGVDYDYNTDIFSLGVTIYQLMTKCENTPVTYLYTTQSEHDVKAKLRKEMERPGCYSNDLIEMVLLMLEKDCRKRLYARNILAFTYFAGMGQHDQIISHTFSDI